MGKWSKIKIRNACQISKGQQLNKINLEKAGDYPCINGGIEPSGYTDKWNTEANTVTISEGGNSCGYVNFLTRRFWSGGHCYSLLGLKRDIDVSFLYHALKGRENLIMGLRVGSGLPNIQQKAIKEFEFDYPESILEQIRIAQILSKADAAINQTEALIAKYQRIKTGLMQDLLTFGIDEHGNIRSKAIHKFVVKNGIEVPEDWEVGFLGDVCSKIQDGTHFSPKTNDDGEYMYLTSKNIRFGYLDLLGAEFINRKEHENIYKRCSVKYGDVMLTKDGANTGNVAINNIKEQFSLLSSVCILRGKDDVLDNNFLLSLILCERGQRMIKDSMSGLAITRVTLQIINQFIFPIPPLYEQIKINNRIQQFENNILFLRNQLKKFNSLKTGLLQDLLSGKVRIKVKENEIA